MENFWCREKAADLKQRLEPPTSLGSHFARCLVHQELCVEDYAEQLEIVAPIEALMQ